MAKFQKHYIAIYNLDKHFVEGIEEYTDEKKYRTRLQQFDLQCQCYGYHLGYKIYDSTEAPFSWEAVTPVEEPVNA